MDYGEALTIISHTVPENPELPSHDFDKIASAGQIVVPWSGGLDSTTAAVWAVHEAGAENVTLLSVSMGQPWDGSEKRARHFIKRDVLPRFQELNHIEVDLPPTAQTYKHIQVGRNLNIYREAVKQLRAAGALWGEVWMGWLQGEVPWASGDKSRAAASFLQAAVPGPWRLNLPTQRFTKAGLVDAWRKTGALSQAAQLYSCFAAGTNTLPCGKCQACFRTFVGYAANGLEGVIPWLYRCDFDEHVAKYEAHGFSSEDRRQETLKAIAVWRRLKASGTQLAIGE